MLVCDLSWGTLADASDVLTPQNNEPTRHWALIPPQRPALPSFPPLSRTSNAIDTFILARLERAGLKLSPSASNETLLCRLSLDLIGLPPTIREVNDFWQTKMNMRLKSKSTGC